MLRLTRWVTLCRRVRDPAGRVRGNVYALHEEPLPLADALYLDPEYMQYLKVTADGHRDRRVCSVARSLIESLQQQIAKGRDILDDSSLGQAGRRAEAMAFFTGGTRQSSDRRYFGFSREAVDRIHRPAETIPQGEAEESGPEPLTPPRSLEAKLDRLRQRKTGDGDGLKNLKTAGADLKSLSEPASTDLKNPSQPNSADLKNLSEPKREQKGSNGPIPAHLKILSEPIYADLKILSRPESGSSGCSCSFFINKETTTTTTTETEQNSAHVHARETVELPAGLSANEQAILGLHLEAVPQEHRQALVDEWDARRRAGLNRNDLSWLAWAAHQLRDGNLTVLTSYALNAERRRRRERALQAQDQRAIAALSRAATAQAGDGARHVDRDQDQDGGASSATPHPPPHTHRHKGDDP